MAGNADEDAPWRLYADLSTPVAVTDGDWRVVFLNEAAQAFFGLASSQALGRVAWEALRITTSGGGDPQWWARQLLLPSLQSDTAAPCLIGGRPAEVLAIPVTHDERAYVVLAVAERQGRAVQDAAVPDWALRDPLTGVHNRHHWQREFDGWNARAGVVLLFDLDGLKQLNDLSGHHVGDQALAAVGRAILAAAPPGALRIRHGGDEFVVVIGAGQAADASALAEAVAAGATRMAREAGIALPLQLSHGLAAYEPGGLAQALREADDALYERKGVLLRGARAGRIILTPAGRERVRKPGREKEDPAAPFAASFGPEFDGYFRAAFARAAQQAREFVDFVRPEAGEAVVEVGAGSGRITFDGGLAERIGPEGQLLVTDPSATQLAIARRRAEDLGLDWVRFVAAPVEDLPIAAGTLDLVLGSTFLHFTDARVTLQAMARAVRSGGRVAVNAIASPRFGSGLLWVLEPALAEMRAAGLTLDDIWVPRARVEGAFTTAGLQIDRAVESSQEQWAAPSAAVAIGFVRQSGLTRLLLRGLAHIPEERRREIEESVEERIREGFGRPDLPWAGDGRTLTLVAHRP